MSIDLRKLRAFAAIAEEKHITRAADRLGMAQPPLSRLLRDLEAEFGAQLAIRLPRGVELTEAGQKLHAEALEVLQRAAAIGEAVRRAAHGEEGRLSVGFTPSSAFHPFVLAAIRNFRTAAPGISVALEEAGTGELAEALQQNRLDAAFVRTPVDAVAGLAAHTLLTEPMVAAIPASRPAAHPATRALAIGALADEDFVLYRRPTGPGLYDAIVSACHRAGFSPRVIQEAPRLTSTLSLVAAGLGVSFVPASMQSLAMEGVFYRPLTRASGLTAPLFLASRREKPSPALARFCKQVAAARPGPAANDAAAWRKPLSKRI